MQADTGHSATAPARAPQARQTECPVMIGNRIDPDIYTVYKGRKVFFCCQACKSAFAEDPERYLPRLPQFAAAGGVGEHEDRDDHERVGGLSPRRLIVPMGIATLVLVAAAVCLGALMGVRRLRRRRLLKIHRIVGVCALAAGAAHAALVFLAD